MSDVRDEWFKLVLDELRKNNDKVDNIKDQVYAKIDELEDKLENRLDESSKQHVDLFTAQDKLGIEHERMNDLLEEHMRRTQAAESRLKILEESTKPLIKKYNIDAAIEERGLSQVKKWSARLGIVSITLGVIISLAKVFQLF